jgi:phage terminase small subunit
MSEKKIKLTDKQEKFVQGVLSGMSQREAYRKAYPNSKMTDEQVDAEASSLLNGTGKYKVNNKVSQRYRELHDKVMQEAEEGTIATAEEIQQFLTSVMRREKTESVVVTLMTEESKWVPNPDTGKSVKQTVKTEKAEIVEIPAKLSDAIKAGELLGKCRGLFNKVDIDLNGEVKVEPVQFFIPDNGRDPDLKKPKVEEE